MESEAVQCPCCLPQFFQCIFWRKTCIFYTTAPPYGVLSAVDEEEKKIAACKTLDNAVVIELVEEGVHKVEDEGEEKGLEAVEKMKQRRKETGREGERP